MRNTATLARPNVAMPGGFRGWKVVDVRFRVLLHAGEKTVRIEGDNRGWDPRTALRGPQGVTGYRSAIRSESWNPGIQTIAFGEEIRS